MNKTNFQVCQEQVGQTETFTMNVEGYFCHLNCSKKLRCDEANKITVQEIFDREMDSRSDYY